MRIPSETTSYPLPGGTRAYPALDANYPQCGEVLTFIPAGSPRDGDGGNALPVARKSFTPGSTFAIF